MRYAREREREEERKKVFAHRNPRLLQRIKFSAKNIPHREIFISPVTAHLTKLGCYNNNKINNNNNSTCKKTNENQIPSEKKKLFTIFLFTNDEQFSRNIYIID